MHATSNPIIQSEDLLLLTTAYLNRIATAVPEHDVHDVFVIFAEQMLADPRLRAVFRRMASRADIAIRFSIRRKVPTNSRRMTRVRFIG